jgi:hypothetical protein
MHSLLTLELSPRWDISLTAGGHISVTSGARIIAQAIWCLDCHNFRDHFGQGDNFTVLFELHEVENYKGMSYVYP